MGRYTLHGTIRSALSGRSYIKTRISRNSPRARITRAASRSLGIPVTSRGWKSKGTRMIRYGQGCLIQILAIALLLTISIIAIAESNSHIPAAYTFTANELEEIRDKIAGGKYDEALADLDGRLDGSLLTFIINPRTGKFHETWCNEIEKIIYPIGYTGSAKALKESGFTACKKCNPK